MFNSLLAIRLIGDQAMHTKGSLHSAILFGSKTLSQT